MARSDVQVGAGDVTFNSVDLGETVGNIAVSFGLETLIHQSDQSTMPEEVFRTGEGIVVTCPLDESSLTQLQYAFPHGTYSVSSTKKQIMVGGSTKYRFSSYAYELLIEPINATNDNENITVYNAVSSQPIEISLSRTAARIWTVVFLGLKLATRDAGEQLYCIGDDSI